MKKIIFFILINLLFSYSIYAKETRDTFTVNGFSFYTDNLSLVYPDIYYSNGKFKSIIDMQYVYLDSKLDKKIALYTLMKIWYNADSDKERMQIIKKIDKKLNIYSRLSEHINIQENASKYDALYQYFGEVMESALLLRSPVVMITAGELYPKLKSMRKPESEKGTSYRPSGMDESFRRRMVP